MNAISKARHGAECTCRAHPLPASMGVRAARDAYLAENGFTAEAYDARWTSASLFGAPIAVPNTRRHAWAIRLHDLHHVATGYGTDPIGEGEISIWEARGPLVPLGLYTASIVMAGGSLGCMLSPARMAAAARASRGKSLFDRSLDYESLLNLRVGALRAMLGLPMDGVADRPRQVHDRAPRAA